MAEKVVFFVMIIFMFSGCTTPDPKAYNFRTLHCNDYGLSIDCNEKRFRQFIDRTPNFGGVLPRRIRSDPMSRGYALVIGINKSNCKKVPNLECPVGEANRVKEILEQNRYSVKILTDETDEKATKQNILDWLKFFVSISGISDSILIYYSGHGCTFEEIEKSLTYNLKSSIRNEYNDKLKKSFFVVPYHESGPGQSGPFERINSLIGNKDIVAILSKSNASQKLQIIDACFANEISEYVFSPVPLYSYELQRQGYLFLCMFNELNEDGKFSPLIFNALEGAADKRTGNNDGIVSMFELISYIDVRVKDEKGPAGAVDNRIKYIIYGSGDIPLALTNRGQ